MRNENKKERIRHTPFSNAFMPLFSKHVMVCSTGCLLELVTFFLEKCTVERIEENQRRSAANAVFRQVWLFGIQR